VIDEELFEEHWLSSAASRTKRKINEFFEI
jgi:hypothetical protein